MRPPQLRLVAIEYGPEAERLMVLAREVVREFVALNAAVSSRGDAALRARYRAAVKPLHARFDRALDQITEIAVAEAWREIKARL